MKSLNAPVVVLFILVLGLTLRIYGLIEKKDYSHDESITLIDGTSNGLRYVSFMTSQSKPFNEISTAKDWKTYTIIHNPYSFSAISNGILKSDLNSPLYYWMVHVFYIMLGVNMYSPLLLNILFTMVMSFLIFQFTKRKLGNTSAMVAMGIFLFSPAVLYCSFEGRSHALYGLITLLYVYQLYRYTYEDKKYAIFWLAVVSLFGFLNQFFFTTVVFGGFVFLMVARRKNIKQLITFVFLHAATLLLSFLIFPVYKTILAKFLGENGTSSASKVVAGSFITRIKVVLYNVPEFFIYGHYTRYVILGLLVVVLGYLIFKKVRWSKLSGLIKVSLFFFLWNVGFMAILYIIDAIPPAVGEQYYMHSWPFLAILVAALFQYLKIKPVFQVGYHLILIISGFLTIGNCIYLNPQLEPFNYSNMQGGLLIINIGEHSIARGHIPRIMKKLPDNQNVLITNSQKIKQHTFDPKTPIFLINYAATKNDEKKWSELVGQELVFRQVFDAYNSMVPFYQSKQ